VAPFFSHLARITVWEPFSSFQNVAPFQLFFRFASVVGSPHSCLSEQPPFFPQKIRALITASFGHPLSRDSILQFSHWLSTRLITGPPAPSPTFLAENMDLPPAPGFFFPAIASCSLLGPFRLAVDLQPVCFPSMRWRFFVPFCSGTFFSIPPSLCPIISTLFPSVHHDISCCVIWPILERHWPFSRAVRAFFFFVRFLPPNFSSPSPLIPLCARRSPAIMQKPSPYHLLCHCGTFLPPFSFPFSPPIPHCPTKVFPSCVPRPFGKPFFLFFSCS